MHIDRTENSFRGIQLSVKESNSVNVDGVDYSLDNLSDYAKSQIASIQFSDRQMLELRNELAISTTARAGYLKALRTEQMQRKEIGT